MTNKLPKEKIAELIGLMDVNLIHSLRRDIYIEELDKGERDTIILEIVEKVFKGSLKGSGEHRHEDWEKGWGENLENLKRSNMLESLRPGYFSENRILRLSGELYRASHPDVEPALLDLVIVDLLRKFCSSSTHVYEFGCGSANNLKSIRKSLPDVKITGLDWAIASQEIISLLRESGDLGSVDGRSFNFFEPDYSFSLEGKSAVLTCAALEQVGDRWQPFVNYLISKKANYVVHIEPISELLNEEFLLDNLSIEYASRRNYLSGYFSGLVELERAGTIKILFKRESMLGSKFINGYSVLVWEVC